MNIKFFNAAKRNAVTRFLAPVAVAFFSVFLASCPNSADNVPFVLPAQQTVSSAPTVSAGGTAANAEAQCVTFRGSVRTGGALPASYAKALEGLGFGGTEEGVEGISKSARPDVTVNGTSIEHFAVATPNVGEPVEGTFSSASSTTFEMPLAIGKKWNIVCGIRNVSGDKKIIMSDSFQIEVTVSNSVLSHVFTLTPYTEVVEGVAPIGNVALIVNFEGSAASSSASGSASVSASWEDQAGGLPALAVEGLAPALITASNVPVGNHRLAIFFRDSNGVSVYESVQVVTVLNGLTTETWMPETGEAAFTSDGHFVVNDNVIKGAASDRIYVGKPAALASNDSVRASDSNSGSAYSPLEHLQAAFNKIQSAGSGSKDFKIFVSGEVVGNAFLNVVRDTHARSVTIEGLDDPDESSKPKSALKGSGSGSVFAIESNVPVTIKNLKITGGSGAGQGGGISMVSGSDLTLDSGALVTQNSATWQGGGVYNGGGSLKIKKGAAISGNWITSARENGSDGGAGLFMYGNSAACVMTGGEISDNNKNSSCNDKNVRGGGVRLGGSARMTLSGGSVSGNFSRNLGGNFYIDGAFLDISGDAKICQGRVDTSSSDDDAWGGALYVEGNSKVTMTGGEISGNTAKAKSSKYACAGVYLSKEFEMTGGVIEGNVVEGGLSSGGAFRVDGLLTIGGSAKIPYGGGEGKNDVYVCKSGSAYNIVQVAASGFSYAASDSAPAAVLAPQGWQRNYSIIKAPSGSDIGAYTPYFKTIDPDFYFGRQSSTVDTAKLKAALCVSNKANAADSDEQNGTKSQPFRTIAFALTKLSGGEPDEIIIDYDSNGDVFGPQEIPDTFTTANCTSLTIRGANGSNLDGTPKDIIDAGGTENVGSALSIASSVPITIKDLKITGGNKGYTNSNDNPNNGGGVSLFENASLTLADGVQIAGNKASISGGGVYVPSGASLYMYGTSCIGDNTQTTASGSTLGSACSNSASYGGGIYNNGKVYLGYKNEGGEIKEAEWTGGVRRNYASTNGGGIYSYSTGDLKMRAGEISYNASHDNYWGGGLGVASNASNGHSVELLGGEIKENSAGLGGAVYVDGAFSMQGALSIPFGVAGAKVSGKNDIYLKAGQTVKVVGALSSPDGDATVATLMPEGVKRTRKILSASSEALINGNKDKFALVSDNDGWQKNYVFDSGHYAELNSPVYVVGMQNSGSTKPDDTWGWGKPSYNAPNGTKTSPYSSVADALGCAELASATEPNTIIIAGTLKGAQTIGTTSISELSLKGYKTATSSAMIDAGGTTDAGSALTVNKSGLTVTITDLTITGGNAENGGGINIAAGTVTLTNGANILGNQATNGGGVYLAGSGSTLYMKGTSVIGDKNEFTVSGSSINLSPTSQTGSGCANKADNGGGIYCNGGNVYVGCDSTGSTSTFTLSSAGGVRRNFASYGGGVYIGGGIFMTGSGQISYNYAYKGAGIYTAAATGHKILGSVNINNNKTGDEGGGLYIASGSTVSMSGSAKITKNNAVGGGGVSIYGTFNMSSGTIGGDSSESGNTSSSGGGVDISVENSSPYPAGTFNMTGGTISYNSCGNNGGGIAIGSRTKSGTTYNGTANISGGIISNNKASSNGGAILQDGILNISGDVSIPYGVTIGGTETKSPGNNDVYLFRDTRTITVASTTLGGGTSVATVTPASWKRGTNIIEWKSGLSFTNEATQKTTIKGQIKLSKDDDGWTRIEKTVSGKKYVCITSPIYVVGAFGTDSTKPTGFEYGKTSGANGTKSSPYASVADALTCADLATVKEITIAGTLVGAQQVISSPGVDITLKGYKAAGETTSSAKIQRFSTRYTTNQTNGSALTVNASGKNVTITDLTITYGAALSGAGIYITAGTVKLGDYAKINDNYAANSGGGVYVNTGATLFMYGKALIGDKLSTDAGIQVAGTDGFDDYANRAQQTGGGGIYNGGAAYIGYSGFGTDGTTLIASSIDNGYGIIRNFNTNEGGGAIYNAGTLKIGSGSISYNQGNNGGAIKCAADATISGGTFTANKALYGGAICVDASKTVTINGSATFTKNQASSSGGGAIYNAGTLTMSAGTIGEDGALNTAETSGGAIYQGGTFNISGSAIVYAGTGVGEKQNDVYLTSTTKYITVNDSLSGSDKVAAVTPFTWKRGNQVIAADGTKITSINATIAGRFAVSDSEWSVTNHSNVGKLDAQLWVSGTGYASGVGAGSDSNRGTKSKPYASIKKAAEQCWTTDKAFTINISGMITGATQEIPAANSTAGTTLASKITLTGLTGNTKDGINRNLASRSAVAGGSALIINYQGYVDMTSLKIMGGNTTGNGGGIQINGPSTFSSTTCPRVNLKTGVLIQQNQAAYGGGIYSSKAILCLSGTATVGNDGASDRSASNTAISNNINIATTAGGGIYNYNGYLYLGGAWIASTINTSLYSLTKGVYANVCSYSGTDESGKNQAAGGIYNFGLFYMMSGNVSYNYGVNTGGVYSSTGSNTEFAMQGGKIHKNAGSGVYNAASSNFCMSGDAVIGDADTVASSDTACSNNNGGLVNYGTARLGYSHGTTKAKLSGGIYGNYRSSGSGINHQSGTIYFDSGTIANNYNTGSGGGIYAKGAVYMTSSSSSQYSCITNNKAKNGGGIFLSGTSAKLFMSGYAIIGTSGKSAPPSSSTATGINYASTSGGGIYAESGPTIYLGYSKWTDGGTSDQATLNGGVCYNYTTSYGGGIYCNASSSYPITIYINSGSINANKVNYGGTDYGHGGGIYANSYTTIYMGGGQISKNSASNFGGGVYAAGDFFMYGTALIGDTGTTVATTGSYGNVAKSGGGVYITGASGRLLMGVKEEASLGLVNETLNSNYGIRHNYANGTSSEITGANPTGFGGGVYFEGELFHVVSGTIGYNLAKKGGGLAVKGDTYANNSGYYHELSGSSYVTGNRAQDGAGLYLYKSSNGSNGLRIYGSIESNDAATDGGNGGGIYNYWSGLEISGSSAKINSNKAANGGGIYIPVDGYESSGNTSWTYVKNGAHIDGNEATYCGGGIYNYDATLYLYTSSISYNKATNATSGQGGAMYIYNYSYTHIQSGTITMTPTLGYVGLSRYNDVFTPGHQVFFVQCDSGAVTVDGKIYITITNAASVGDTIVGVSGSAGVTLPANKYELTSGSAYYSNYKIGSNGKLVVK